jgi:hypothetical protein
MREFGITSAFWRAILFNRPFYQDVALRWKGIGFWYLTLLLMLTWFVVLIPPTVSLTHFINTEAPTALKIFPPITIKSGHVSSPVEQPYIMKDNAGHPIFVLDTTGAIKRPSDVGAKLLLAQTELVQEEGRGSLKTTPLAGFPDWYVDQTSILGYLKAVRNLFIPVGLVIMLLITLIYRLICILLIAALGLAFASANRIQLSYAALLRLAAVGLTAPLLISTIFWMLPSLNMGCLAWIGGQLLIFAIAAGYVAYGVKVTAAITREAHAFPVDLSPPSPPLMPPSPEPPQDPRFP